MEMNLNLLKTAFVDKLKSCKEDFNYVYDNENKFMIADIINELNYISKIFCDKIMECISLKIEKIYEENMKSEINVCDEIDIFVCSFYRSLNNKITFLVRSSQYPNDEDYYGKFQCIEQLICDETKYCLSPMFDYDKYTKIFKY